MELIQPLHNQRGFTMIEMLIAFLLMAVGVITSLSMITTALKSDSIANRLTAKASLAQQVMEDLLARRIDDPDISLSALDRAYDLDPTRSGNNILIEGAGSFQAQYSTFINDPEANITRIVITITSIPNDGSPFLMTCYKRTI